MLKNILILFGGKSTEYDVSLCSAASVLRNISHDAYTVYALGITKDGQWLLSDGDPDAIENNTWQTRKTHRAWISPNCGEGVFVEKDSKNIRIPIDVVFPVLHGKNGEDGTIQGLLEIAGLPCVGSSTLAAALTMDKAITNLLADYYHILQAKWRAIDHYTYLNQKESFLQEAEDALGYPIFVKPACAGSSVGVTKAADRAALEEAMTLAFSVDDKVVLEETIKGREIECAVLGNEAPIASAPGEIEPCAEFYDYDAKYVSDSKLYIPARVDEKTARIVQEEALKIFQFCNCSGLSRVDFFLTEDNRLFFNEINTIPGFTKISMYAKLFAYSGIPYSELIDRLLFFAEKRFRRHEHSCTEE